MQGLLEFLWSYFITVFWGWFGIVVGVLTVVDIIERAVEKSTPTIPVRIKIYIAITLLIVAQISAYKSLKDDNEKLRGENTNLKTVNSQKDQQIADLKNNRPIQINPQIQLPEQPQHSMVLFKMPEPVHEPATPFRAGQIPTFNIYYYNAGAFPVLDTSLAKSIIVVSAHSSLDEVSKHFHSKPGELRNGSDLPNSQLADWDTVTLDHALTQEEATKLNAADSGLCILAMVRWRDRTGRYATDFFGCIWGGQSVTVWNSGPLNNRERKISN